VTVKLDKKRYVPIVRSRDAELKGFIELSDKVKDSILPVIEFTKSRRTKTNPNGAVAVCVAKVKEGLGDRFFIADVTSMEALSSAETDGFLDPSNSFQNWRAFVATQLPLTCVPVVHLTDPFDPNSVALQAAALIHHSGYIAFRIPPGYEHALQLAALLVATLGSLERCIVICDGGYVTRGSLPAMSSDAKATLQIFAKPLLRAVAASSFPSSVVLPDYGGDDYGKFPLLEVTLSEDVKSATSLADVVHGDYGLIHPADMLGTVTNWVPRVDVPLPREVYYRRYRRDAGGYVYAARLALADPAYQPIGCWADANIRDAAAGNPQGRSPAHWIAVRVNLHITRQVERLT